MHFLACRGGGGIKHGESWNTLHRSQDGYELLGSRAMLGAVLLSSYRSITNVSDLIDRRTDYKPHRARYSVSSVQLFTLQALLAHTRLLWLLFLRYR